MILQKFKRCYYFSIAGYSMAGLSLLGIPLSDYDGSVFEKGFTYSIAAVFWLSLIFGTVFFAKTSRYCKIIEKKLKRNKIHTYNPKVGVIRFFSNKNAKVIDSIFFIFAAVVIALTIADVQIEWLMISCLVITFLSFVLHSFFNGKSYLYIKAYNNFLNQKELKENE